MSWFMQLERLGVASGTSGSRCSSTCRREAVSPHLVGLLPSAWASFPDRLTYPPAATGLPPATLAADVPGLGLPAAAGPVPAPGQGEGIS